MLNRFRLWLAEKLIPKEHKEFFIHGFKDELVLHALRVELERSWRAENKKLSGTKPFGFSQELLDKMQEARVRAREPMLLAVERPAEFDELEQS